MTKRQPGRRPRVPSYTVGAGLFRQGIKCYSGDLIGKENIKPPVRWVDRWWSCTTMQLSHGVSWLNLYDVIPMEEWDGEVFVHGAWDDEWLAQRSKTSYAWHGCRVTISGDKSAREWVLGTKVRWHREPREQPPEQGQSWKI